MQIGEQGPIVILDGPPQNDVKMRPKISDFRIFPSDHELELGELLALAELVDHRKSTNDVEIPAKLKIKPIPEAVKNYGYSESCKLF